MFRPVVLVVFCCIGAAQARAQQPPLAPPGSGVGACIFADRAFSTGAYLCVAKSVAVTCSDGRWSTQRAQTCDHDLDPFKPSYGR